MFSKRTDLALEAKEIWQESAEKTTKLSGVKAKKHLIFKNFAVKILFCTGELCKKRKPQGGVWFA